MKSKENAIRLANKALNNPLLLNELSEDVFFKFVLGVAKYDMCLAIKLENLKPFTNSSNKCLFWEAVGILMPVESYV